MAMTGGGGPSPTSTGGKPVTPRHNAEGALLVEVCEPSSAFGEMTVASNTPIDQEDSVYAILTDRIESFVGTSGTATITTAQRRLFEVTCGTDVGGYGVLRSRRRVIYRPGQGLRFLITGLFGTGVASYTSRVGALTVTDALAFGYNGTAFGVLHEYGGAVEIRVLTISSAATGAETATVTLNGTAYTVDLTNAGGTIQTAYEVAQGTYTGWNVQAVGSAVIFSFQGTDPKSGSYSFSSSTAAGTFAQTTAGVAKTADWVPQASWNIDTCDGNGPSGMTLDPTKLNVYGIDLQYLGGGAVVYRVEDPGTGALVPVHRLQYANSATLPSLAIPALRPGIVSASLGSTTDITVQSASWAAFVQGSNSFSGRSRAVFGTKSVGTSPVAIGMLQVLQTLGGKALNCEVDLLNLSAASDSTKQAVIEMWVVADPANLDALITGTKPQFYYEEEGQSCALLDVTATTIDTSGSGIRRLRTMVIKEGDKMGLAGEFLLPGETLIVSAYVTGGSASDVSVTMEWRELL